MNRDFTPGQKTAQQALHLIRTLQKRRPRQTRPYDQDLQRLREILERCVQEADHPVNSLMLTIRSWGYQDGEALLEELEPPTRDVHPTPPFRVAPAGLRAPRPGAVA